MLMVIDEVGVPGDGVSGSAGDMKIGESRFRRQNAGGCGFCCFGTGMKRLSRRGEGILDGFLTMSGVDCDDARPQGASCHSGQVALLNCVHPEAPDVTLLVFTLEMRIFFGLARNFCLQKLTAKAARRARPEAESKRPFPVGN
jgi:hypothetical protein